MTVASQITNAIQSASSGATSPRVPGILRSAPPKRRGIRIGIMMMEKDEDDHLRSWLDYHSFLFGPENLYVWDNDSSSDKCRHTLGEYESRGVIVNYDLKTPTDFRRKGITFGQKMNELDAIGSYDFYFPLDCDEFLAVEYAPGVLRCDPDTIAEELAELSGEDRALGIQWAYYNIIGHKDYFWRIPHIKTFFRTGTFEWMDHGYHEGRAKVPGRRETRFVYIHYHYKPHAVIVKHSVTV